MTVKKAKQPILTPPWLAGFFLLASIESLVCGWVLFQIPGDSDNAVFAGLSLPRLLVLLVLAAGLFITLWLAFLSVRRESFSNALFQFLQKNNRSLWAFLGLFTLLMWLAVFMPGYRAGDYFAYFERLKPLLTWFLLVSLQSLLVLSLQSLRATGGDRLPTGAGRFFRLSLVFSSGFLAIYVLIAVTRWGISPIVQFWEKAGVPILPGQVWFAWLAAIGFLWLANVSETKGWLLVAKNPRVDLALFLIIWAASAFLWVSEPMQFNHFNPGPFPPNNQYYPNSDAETYDLAAQKALIGVNPGYVDKPLYSTLLLGLHLIAGQDANLILDLQTALLAVFPAVLYLIGTRFHNRSAGLLAALLANFKEINAIRAQMLIWKTATPKLMMSEFTNTVLLALLVLLLWQWFTGKQKVSLSALAVGGVLGLAVLIRHNNWLFLPLVIVFSLAVFWKQKKRWLVNAALFTAMLFGTVAPWMVYSYQNYGQALPFMTALRGAVFEERINPLLDQATPTPSPTPEPTSLNSADAYGKLAALVPASMQQAAAQDTSGDANQNPLAVIIHPVIDAIVRHFCHNLISTAFTLPVTPVMDDLETTFRASAVASLWDVEWSGRLTMVQIGLLMANLVIVCAGIAWSYQRWRWAGLIPLVINLAYNFATAFATTSGGRYLVPVDWVFYLYFAFGMVVLLAFLFDALLGVKMVRLEADTPTQTSAPARRGYWTHGLLALLFLLVGVTPALGMSGFAQRYPVLSQAEIVDRILLANPGFDMQTLQPFVSAVEQGELEVRYGRLLYPKYLDYQDDRSDEPDIAGWKENKPSLVFNLIGSQEDFRWGRLVLPQAPEPIPGGPDAVIFTCPNLEVHALVILDEQPPRVIVRPDWPDIDCDS